MPYNLFLDDVRELNWVYPDAVVSEWVVCRNFNDAVSVVNAQGWPHFVSFDHDLGESDAQSGYDFAQWLVQRDLDRNGMPNEFAFAVHSANPVGAANINGLLNGYLKFRG